MNRPDPNLQQRRAADPAASVWVAASAGTGKTKVLTERVLNLLLGGTEPHKILCLTFTKAAAAEMANRIAERLAKWVALAEGELAKDLTDLSGVAPDKDRIDHARRLFAHVLDAPGGMKIQTIHAFCQSLLRRFPIEAGIAPHFEVMDERDAGELMLAARDEVLGQAREGADPQLAQALATVTARVHEVNFPDLMGELIRERGRLRRMIAVRGGVEPLISATRKRLGIGENDTPEGVTAAACSHVDETAMRGVVQALLSGTKTDVERGELLAAWLASPERRVADFETYCLAFLTKDGAVRKTLMTKKIAEAHPGPFAAINAEAHRLFDVLSHIKAVTVGACTAALLRLGDALLKAYGRHKSLRAVMDYDDLILAARGLLEEQPGAAWVLFKLDGGLDHVLIDEAQDTNPDQWSVVGALIDEFFAGSGVREPGERTVFAVGDRKQSIYSFQGADPRAFEAMRGRLSKDVPAVGAKWDEVALHISFRSTQSVLDAVNAVLETNAGRDGVVLEGEEVTHYPFREKQAGLVEVWPPLDPEPRDEPPPWKLPVERVTGDSAQSRLANAIAYRIHEMVADGEMLESRGRPIRADDIMVLVRRRTGFVEDLVRALKKLGVETAGVDRMTLTEQMAVMDLMALGNFLLLPEDDLTLATVLKSPLIGLGEDELFTVAWGRKGSLWEALKGHDAHKVLADLLALTDYLTPHDLYAHVLGKLGGRKKLLGRLGPEADDPIDEFMNLTLAYERTHAPSLQGFLHWLETGQVEVKRDLEQSSRNAVRIMTVHGCKGLQAPIVFMPDTLQAPTKIPNLLWDGEGAESLLLWSPRADLADAVCTELRDVTKRDRDREYRRLLYVAMTRAEDRLYVCGWNTRKRAPEGCWHQLISQALAPIAAEDGEVLRLSNPQEAEVEFKGMETPETKVVPLADWAFSPPEPEPSPVRPLAPSRPASVEPAVRSPFGADDGTRFRRGRLIHRLLQSLPDLAPEAREQAAKRFLLHAAGDLAADERVLIATETIAVLNHPSFASLFGPGSMPEVPVVGLVKDQAVSGQVDRLVVEAERVRIIDYKTNRPPPEKEADVPLAYFFQMATYRAALRRIYPDREVECLLLWTDGPRLMTLSPERLDSALDGV